ncbi:hypothetical protein DFH06DRAFT_1239754 [Mycena polygramma]|nr:hypothetical protein DFH06DRAFT_1239754 [Mycena polygramma]
MLDLPENAPEESKTQLESHEAEAELSPVANPMRGSESMDSDSASPDECLERKMPSLRMALSFPDLLDKNITAEPVEGQTAFSQHEDLPSHLVTRHEDLERKMSSLRIHSAPHDKLPPEIMAEVFLFCSTTPVVLPPKADEPLLALTQICRTWRELALNVPELWASISVTFTEEQSDVERMADFSQQWLARAGKTYPLSITAECTGTYANTACEDPDVVATFVPMVISHAHRLRHFDLAFPIAALLPIFELPHGAFPCLETMNLRPLLLFDDMTAPETGYAAWHWPATCAAFDSAPRMRQVTFNPLPLFKLAELEIAMEDIMDRAVDGSNVGSHPFFAPTFSLPWSQLSIISFTFTALTAEAWYTVLTQCPKLEHFEAAIKPSLSNEDDSTGNMIQLDSLTHLSISAFSGGGEDLIDRLIAPQLNLLVLMGSQISATSIMSFQARSAFVLKTFIPVIPILADDVTSLFTHLADVTTLVMIAISTEHFPGAFWEAVGRAELLPQLEALMIRPTATQAPVLVDTVAARWEAAVAGQGPNLTVGFCDVRPAHIDAVEEELRRLEKYAEGGRTVDMLTVC